MCKVAHGVGAKSVPPAVAGGVLIMIVNCGMGNDSPLIRLLVSRTRYDHQSSLRANWRMRLSPSVDVIRPAVGEPMFAFGKPNDGVLNN